MSSDLEAALAKINRSGMGIRPQGDKVQRSLQYSVAADQGKIYLVPGPVSTEAVLSEHHNFPPPPRRGHDDMVDTGSLAWNYRHMAGGSRVTRLKW